MHSGLIQSLLLALSGCRVNHLHKQLHAVTDEVGRDAPLDITREHDDMMKCSGYMQIVRRLDSITGYRGEIVHHERS